MYVPGPGLGEERQGGWEWGVDSRNFMFCCSGAGYTFGVLAFLRSLRGWGSGLGEEREGGWEWGVDSHNFRFCCCGKGYTFGVLAFLRSLRGWGPGLVEERERGTGAGSGWPQLYIFFPRRGILSEFLHF